MGEVLTLDILRGAVAKIKALEYSGEIVGFKVNPADLRKIREGTMSYCGVVNNSFLMIPPYQGLRLEADVAQPRGYVEAIKRCH